MTGRDVSQKNPYFLFVIIYSFGDAHLRPPSDGEAVPNACRTRTLGSTTSLL